MSPAKVLTWILLPILNQMVAFSYGYFCKTFVDYWRSPESGKIGNTIEHTDTEEDSCQTCKDHKNNTYVRNDNMSICVFCNTKPGNNGKRILLGYGKASDNERKLLKEIEGHDHNVTAISKLVTAATENSFMPLLHTLI